jgi:hypothetical protein
VGGCVCVWGGGGRVVGMLPLRGIVPAATEDESGRMPMRAQSSLDALTAAAGVGGGTAGRAAAEGGR